MGIDLLLQFAEETGAIPPDAAEIYRNEALKALRTGAARHASSLVDIHPAEKFVETLTTLCAQSKVALLDPDSMRGPPDGVEMIGWRRGDLALILPDAVHRRVSIFLRESGDHWAPSLRDLHRDLVARGYALASADGRDAGQWRVGADHKKKRGWIIPTNALGLASILGASNSAPNLGATASHSGGTAPPAISLNFQEESKACLPCPQCLHVLEGEGEPGANVVVKS
jgi:hypothetical protein